MLKKHFILLSPDAPAGGAPAAPASPAPAPSTPAAQPGTTDVTQPPPSKSSDPFGELSPKPTPKADPKAPADDKGAKPGEVKKPDTNGDKKFAKTKDPANEGNSVIKTLRERGDKAERELKELQARFDASSNRGDETAMAKLLEQKEAEIKNYQQQIARYDYRKHPEFVEKFKKPFEDASKRAQRDIEALDIAEMNGDEEVQRPAKWQDFTKLWRMDRRSARNAAKAMFKEDADIVMRHYDNLHDLNEQGEAAANDYASKAHEMEAAERSKEIQTREKMTTAFKTATDDLIQTYADKYGERPDKPELNELWKKALATVDKAYFQRHALSPEEQIQYDAAIRLRAAHSVVLEKENADLRAELEELRGEKEEKENSSNGRVARRAEPAKGAENDLEKMERAIFK